MVIIRVNKRTIVIEKKENGWTFSIPSCKIVLLRQILMVILETMLLLFLFLMAFLTPYENPIVRFLFTVPGSLITFPCVVLLYWQVAKLGKSKEQEREIPQKFWKTTIVFSAIGLLLQGLICFLIAISPISFIPAERQGIILQNALYLVVILLSIFVLWASISSAIKRTHLFSILFNFFGIIFMVIHLLHSLQTHSSIDEAIYILPLLALIESIVLSVYVHFKRKR